MPSITVRLTEATRQGLDALALHEHRDPREQAALLIEQALYCREQQSGGSLGLGELTRRGPRHGDAR